jgi:hypothetical protein
MPSVYVDGQTVLYINSILYFKKNPVNVIRLSLSGRKLGTHMQHSFAKALKIYLSRHGRLFSYKDQSLQDRRFFC